MGEIKLPQLDAERLEDDLVERAFEALERHSTKPWGEAEIQQVEEQISGQIAPILEAVVVRD